MYKKKLFTDFRIDDKTKKLFNIPKIEEIDNHEEIWRYAIFDRHKELTKKLRYLVSTYGRVYDIDKNKLVEYQTNNFFKTSVGKYLLVSVYTGKKKYKYLVHRLVALAFIPPVKDKPLVNHIDGDPSHPYVWNLEWCNTSDNYIHALKNNLKIEKRGEERSNAKWTNNEIHLICKMMEEGHKATFIYNALLKLFPNDERIKYERVRTLYKHIIKKTHWTQISKLYNIDFSRYNYLKETGSVKKAKSKS